MEINSLEEYEVVLEQMIEKTLCDFIPLFLEKGIDLKYNGISHHGKIDDDDYTSEVEVTFHTKNRVDYLDVCNLIIVLHKKKNYTEDQFNKILKIELEKILEQPGRDWS